MKWPFVVFAILYWLGVVGLMVKWVFFEPLFSVFVLPFMLGVILLLFFSIVKYWRWINSFDKLQRAIIRKNIWSWRFLPAIWEAFREGLLHWRITKKMF